MSAELEEKYLLLQQELEDVKAEYRDFSYAVVHDLSAPFRQIEGFSNIILSKHGSSFDEKTKRHFSLIIGGSEKGKAILDALFDYSRIIASDEEHKQVDCGNLIEEVQTDLSTLIEESGAQIMVAETPVVKGKKTQLFQVFYHLIHNALHYQKSGSAPKILIAVKETKKEWQFCVKDNGIGIGSTKPERLFTALKRGVAEKDYAGIGMGLTITKSVVQSHGGKIYISTDQDTGSSIHFTLGKVISNG